MGSTKNPSLHLDNYTGRKCVDFFGTLKSIKKLAVKGQTAEARRTTILQVWNKNHIHRKRNKMKRQRAMYQKKEQTIKEN